MTLENLARINRLQPHTPAREEIRKLLAGAARSLKDARNPGISDAARFTLAYTAIMEAAQAALFANGYRPSKSEGGHHMTMVQSLVHTIGLDPVRMKVLDNIRHKRNVIDYSGEDAEPSEAAHAIASAQALLDDVNAWLTRNHPELS
ncbi:MAG: DNA-binding protein [Proteobacteria bacterium]|nr:DNA-binding protein [Pseudomonadota bacterium]